MNRRVIARARKLFDQAERAVEDDPKLLHRVQVARLPIMYVQIVRAGGAFQLIKDVFPGSDRLFGQAGGPVKDAFVNRAAIETVGVLDRFEKIARKEGVTHIREGRSFKNWLQEKRKQQRGAIPVVRLDNGAIEVVVVPEIGGRIWQITDLARKRSVLNVPKAGAADALCHRDCNYEEYSGEGWRSPGYNEPYKVDKRTKRSITMTAKLPKGLTLARTIALDPKAAVVRIRSTLSNPSKKPVDACLRVHPCFAVGKIDDAVVHLRTGEGKWQRKPLKLTKDPKAEKEAFLSGDAKPAGVWLLADAASDYGVMNTFDVRQVDRCLLNWCGRSQRVNLELFSAARSLAPGRSITIEHAYELTDGASKLSRGK